MTLPDDVELRQLDLLTADIDDDTAENLAFAEKQLFEGGALDVVRVPVVMKKGRQGTRLEVLCEEENRKDLLRVIFRETTTIGVRHTAVQRYALTRESATIEVAGHPVRIKVVFYGGQPLKAKPEHEDCVEAARATGRPVRDIVNLARRIARDKLGAD